MLLYKPSSQKRNEASKLDGGMPENEASSPISVLFSRFHSNKESDPEKYALKLKLHQGGVRRCQYSGDGSKVVSCSVEGDVKVR